MIDHEKYPAANVMSENIFDGAAFHVTYGRFYVICYTHAIDYTCLKYFVVR